MFILKEKNSKSIIVNKSTFISIIYPLNCIEDVNRLINETKQNYPKAKHYLYAYKFNNIAKSNDDNEPGKIANSFITLLDRANLNNVLIIVVRYFGGVLLGASRLHRTYMNLVSETLKDIKTFELVEVFKYSMEVDYKTFNRLKDAGYFIEKVDYFDKIKLVIISRDDILSNLKCFKISNISVVKIKKAI